MITKALGPTFRYSHSMGRPEAGGPGFQMPVAMARGKGDRLYVVNRSELYRPHAKRVTICTVGEEYQGEFARGVTDIVDTEMLHVVSDDALLWPTSIAVDSSERVYVADEWLNRISIFSREGDWIGKWGIAGDGDGRIDGPSGLAFDAEDNLYLVDGRNNRIQKFTKDGRFLLKWGWEGTGDGEFNLPWGIDVDRQGNVYVADWRNDRIQKFSPDGSFLMKFGSSGQGEGQFNRPTGVAVDGDGVIYVADWFNNRVQVLDREGQFMAKLTGDATVSKWGKEKIDSNPDMWKEREVAQDLDREKFFWKPIAVEADAEGRILVMESTRNRIQVYRKIASYFLGRYDNGRL